MDSFEDLLDWFLLRRIARAGSWSRTKVWMRLRSAWFDPRYKYDVVTKDWLRINPMMW